VWLCSGEQCGIEKQCTSIIAALEDQRIIQEEAEKANKEKEEGLPCRIPETRQLSRALSSTTTVAVTGPP